MLGKLMAMGDQIKDQYKKESEELLKLAGL